MFLNENGITALSYHAGFSLDERRRRRAKWNEGHVKVIVATSAFGVGINSRKDVRLVVVSTAPSSIPDLWQLIGRAGRDGLPAKCIVLYHPAQHRNRWRFVLGDAYDRERVIANMSEVNYFCTQKQCRHVVAIRLLTGSTCKPCSVACDICP